MYTMPNFDYKMFVAEGKEHRSFKDFHFILSILFVSFEVYMEYIYDNLNAH